MAMKKYLFCLILGLLASTSSMANVPAEAKDPRSKQLLNILTKAKEKYGLKAILMGVWINDKEVMTVALGESMADIAASKNMHYRMGGATYTYLTTLLLQLVDQKKVSLQDKLSRWFPELPQAESITLEMLARSTTGYYDYVQSKQFQHDVLANVFREWKPDELIKIGVSQPLLYPPGKGWNYSHTNYVILAAVLEKITGEPLSVSLKKNIFDKLKLENTQFPLTPDIQHPALHTYTAERGVYEDSTYWNPSWTGHSARMTANLPDAGKWLMAYGSGKLLSAQSYHEIIAPVTIGLGQNKPHLYYGLGVIVANSWIMQNPAFAGFSGVIAYLPKKKIAVYITTTQADLKSREEGHAGMKIFKEVADYLTPANPVPEELG
jgi:D-alanyl-D-alanine carboxypeptidase